MTYDKTYMIKKENITRNWYLFDASNLVLGRLASHLSLILQGKNKAIFTPHQDCGDFVVVINLEKIVLTGKKWKNKLYYSHSGYPGGLKQKTASELFQKSPTILLEKAVKGMLPRNRLTKPRMKRLFLYPDAEHKHRGQNPQQLTLK